MIDFILQIRSRLGVEPQVFLIQLLGSFDFLGEQSFFGKAV